MYLVCTLFDYEDVRQLALHRVSDPVETIPVAPGNGFLLEAESFEAAVRGGPGQWTGATQDESLDIAMMLDAILLSMRGGGRVAVG